MNDEQRRAILPELDRLTAESREMVRKLEALIAEHDLHKAGNIPEFLASAYSASALWGDLQRATNALRREFASDIQDYVTSWYHALHYDMSDPLVQLKEGDVPDPVYESCTYDDDEKWIVIMQTPTHGREKVVVMGDGVDFQIYSAEKI